MTISVRFTVNFETMKKLLLLFAVFPFYLNAQVCASGSNVVLFTNYDGGVLNINVDVNIPNLKIGIVSYEAVQVNFSGPYVNNITEIRYAGFNSSNNNCSQSIYSTSFSGLPGSAITSINFAPPATVSDPNGNNSIICAYSCTSGSSQGGCNTVDQIVAYFYQNFNVNSLYSHTIQYSCWTGTQNISAGGNCCPISTPTPLFNSISSVNNSCAGNCSGSATAATSGGTSPYTYAWSANANNATTATVSNLCAGTYFVTVTDAVGAQITSSITIIAPSALLVAESIVNPVCHGQTGSMQLNVSGGVAPYTTNWNGVNSLQVLAGNHTVTVLDANSCEFTLNYEIIEPDALIGDFTILPDIGFCNGSISIFVQGGVAPFSYSWVGLFNTSSSLNNVCGNIYCVEVTDANACAEEFCGMVFYVASIIDFIATAEVITLAPNPSSENTILTITNTIQQEYTIRVVEVSGKEMFVKKINSNGTSEVNVSIPAVTSGVYFINVLNNVGVIETLKWVQY